MEKSTDFTPEELDLMLANLDQYDEIELAEIYKLVEELDVRETRERQQEDLLAFCQFMQADYKVGAHHKKLAALLEGIEQGEKDRICVSVPPRHGKSQMVSIYYAAWYLGRHPDHKVMLVSHTGDLAVDFGRKIRNIVASDKYQEVFPGVELAKDSKSAGRWNTSHGGEFFACGVGAALAGRGAHLLIVDDPHSEQDVLSGNFEIFKKAYEWFSFGARTRLMPGGRVAIVHCMTGDTGVLRPDGTETPLRAIRPGDMVMSYDGAGLVPKKVLNWANQGPDCVYAIKMSCGTVVRANARHPFLVDRDGVQTWVKVRDLKPGESILKVTGVSGAAKPARPQTVARPHIARGCVSLTTTKCGGLPGSIDDLVKVTGTPTSNTATVSLLKITTGCGTSRAADARYVESHHTKGTSHQTGTVNWQSTTATTQNESVHSSATSVISWLGTEQTLSAFEKASLTSSRILSITPDGEEEVFDIQVEDTENFIANGLVSHNTRWHQDDLIGSLVRDMTANPEADQYEVFEFPAILEVTDKETGEIVEKALWPEFFDLDALKRTKASMPTYQWNAQYQQTPTSEEGAIIKREWWKLWQEAKPPECDYIIMSLDAAAEAHNQADFTSLTTWGVFFNEETGANNLILLNAIKRRIEFPELKRLAYQEYTRWEPDAFIVEKKSSGVALYQEMRRAGVPVTEYTPSRGTANNPNTKMARLNSVADIVAAGVVWVPNKTWADDLVEEIAAFPYASHDDQVDSTIMALMRFRQGGFLKLASDAWEDEVVVKQRIEYY